MATATITRLLVCAAGAAWLGCDSPASRPSDRGAMGNEEVSHGARSTTDHVTKTATGFRPRPAIVLARAIGTTAMLPEPAQRAFHPTDSFDPLLPPQPGEWLAEHVERGQTYDQFVEARWNRPDEERHVIGLLPYGALRTPALSFRQMARFVEAYFGVEVRVMQPVPVDPVEVRSRRRETHQLLTGDILTLLRRRLPDDAYALIAVTDADLYPGDPWNFAFGQAMLRDRVGVQSVRRYDPGFYGLELDPAVAESLITRRTLTVMAHEIGHMFGLEHCTHYRCVMGGANDLREVDGKPIHLCPVCLRKLYKSVGFDIGSRYAKLQAFYRKAGLEGEARWVGRRLDYLGAVRSDR